MAGVWGSAYAAAAGLLGALAACAAKLALGADYLRGGCAAVAGSAAGPCDWYAHPAIGWGFSTRLRSFLSFRKPSFVCGLPHPTTVLLPIVLQAGCGGLVVACNAIMWTFFAKALKYSSSSATATVTSTASNFISSAFLGNLLFGETHALLWWIGITVTLFGLLLLHTAPPPSEEQRHPKEKKT